MNSPEDIERQSYLAGPRSWGIRQFLYDTALRWHVRLMDVSESKGLLRTTVYYTARGSEDDVLGFLDAVRRTARDNS